MSPFFSVIVPVYNRADVLADAMRSVLEQSWQDFELIVIDDGSQDNSAEVALNFADPRIRVHRQDNRGGGAARNAGIDLARGRFVAFLDSDDRYLPNHLETMQKLLADTSGVVGYARMVVDRGNGRTFLKPPRGIRPDEHMATYLLCDRGFVPTITVSVETEVARTVRYNEVIRTAEDADFAIRLYLAGCRFVMVEAPGAVWRDVPDPKRTSAGRKGGRLVPWLEDLKRHIPAKSYYGCRGWAIAKHVAMTSRSRALGLYLSAVLRGCYPWRLAGVVFLQIFMSDRLYRRLADTMIART